MDIIQHFPLSHHHSVAHSVGERIRFPLALRFFSVLKSAYGARQGSNFVFVVNEAGKTTTKEEEKKICLGFGLGWRVFSRLYVQTMRQPETRWWV